MLVARVVLITNRKELNKRLSKTLDRYAEDKLLPELLSLGGNRMSPSDIIDYWDEVAQNVLKGLPTMYTTLYQRGGHGLNITKEGFLSFFDDKELGSRAWSEYETGLDSTSSIAK